MKNETNTAAPAAPDIAADLDFEPDEFHSIADMANVGYSLMQAIKSHRPEYCWNETPAEIVGDLLNERDEAMGTVPGGAAAPAPVAGDAWCMAFVAGAKWWEWEKTGATMWQSDQQKAYEAAVKKSALAQDRASQGAAATPKRYDAPQLFAVERLPPRDEAGRLSHPDLSIVLFTEDEWDVGPFFAAAGHELKSVRYDWTEDDDNDGYDMNWLTPEAPDGEGWLLVSIDDNEDGEGVVWWSRFVGRSKTLPSQGAAAGVPEGWRLVPVEPTPEQVDAARQATLIAETFARSMWAAMLAAAPSAPTQGAGREDA